MPVASLRPGSLHDVLAQALSLYDGLFPGIVLERRLCADLPQLRLDFDQMKRAVINLVDNAIEATDGKGRIELLTEYDRGAGRVRLSVCDDGPGIAPADRDQLFVPTSRPSGAAAGSGSRS
jgi:signal transduction histidine kinase